MRFRVYIYGNSVGEVEIVHGLGGRLISSHNRELIKALKQLNCHESFATSVKELLKGGYSFATFGEGIGELRVV